MSGAVLYEQLGLPVAEVPTGSRWCQRWRRRRLSWQRADPAARFDGRHYTVGLLDEPMAKAYVREHHYLGTYPAAAIRCGLFRAGRLVGVAVFSVPAQAAVLAKVLPGLEPYRESLELGRFVLDDGEPGNTETWFLARCFTDFVLPAGVRGVVSFADPVCRRAADGSVVAPGHVGWIYQAMAGSLYTGRATARTLLVLPDGRTLHPRTVQKIRRQERGHDYAERQLIALGAAPPRAGQRPREWLEQALGEVGVRRLRHGGCHRYVFRLGRNRRERERIRVRVPALPYPKRPDPIDGLWLPAGQRGGAGEAAVSAA